MTAMGNRAVFARRYATAALRRGDPTGWFEPLYAAAARGETLVPWAELTPNRHLVSWTAQRYPAGSGRALVVGCGLGDDAEHLASLGFTVTAFDVAPTAIDSARARFPQSTVDYRVADVFALPPEWCVRYDLVLEAYTVQVYQGALRTEVARHVCATVVPGGTLLVIAHARPLADGAGPPWHLTRADVQLFAQWDMSMVALAEVADDNPPGLLWRAEFRRAHHA